MLGLEGIRSLYYKARDLLPGQTRLSQEFDLGDRRELQGDRALLQQRLSEAIGYFRTQLEAKNVPPAEIDRVMLDYQLQVQHSLPDSLSSGVPKLHVIVKSKRHCGGKSQNAVP